MFYPHELSYITHRYAWRGRQWHSKDTGAIRKTSRYLSGPVSCKGQGWIANLRSSEIKICTASLSIERMPRSSLFLPTTRDILCYWLFFLPLCCCKWSLCVRNGNNQNVCQPLTNSLPCHHCTHLRNSLMCIVVLCVSFSLGALNFQLPQKVGFCGVCCGWKIWQYKTLVLNFMKGLCSFHSSLFV